VVLLASPVAALENAVLGTRCLTRVRPDFINEFTRVRLKAILEYLGKYGIPRLHCQRAQYLISRGDQTFRRSSRLLPGTNEYGAESVRCRPDERRQIKRGATFEYCTQRRGYALRGGTSPVVCPKCRGYIQCDFCKANARPQGSFPVGVILIGDRVVCSDPAWLVSAAEAREST
jgi:hypothetical protein